MTNYNKQTELDTIASNLKCVAPNQATKIMLTWTILYESGCSYERGATFEAEGVKENWMEDMYNHGEEYDEEWFPLVATPSINKTIDWQFIADQLPNYINYE